MTMADIAEKIAHAFGYPLSHVKEGIIFSSDGSIDSVIAYCESKKKENENGKEKADDRKS